MKWKNVSQGNMLDIGALAAQRPRRFWRQLASSEEWGNGVSPHAIVLARGRRAIRIVIMTFAVLCSQAGDADAARHRGKWAGN